MTDLEGLRRDRQGDRPNARILESLSNFVVEDE